MIPNVNFYSLVSLIVTAKTSKDFNSVRTLGLTSQRIKGKADRITFKKITFKF